jgi:hypothetical protein
VLGSEAALPLPVEGRPRGHVSLHTRLRVRRRGARPTDAAGPTKQSSDPHRSGPKKGCIASRWCAATPGTRGPTDAAHRLFGHCRWAPGRLSERRLPHGIGRLRIAGVIGAVAVGVVVGIPRLTVIAVRDLIVVAVAIRRGVVGVRMLVLGVEYTIAVRIVGAVRSPIPVLVNGPWRCRIGRRRRAPRRL